MAKAMTTAALVKLARKGGALHAKVIPSSKVFTAAWVRLKCRYGCGGYGSSLMCPPHSPTPDETRRVLDDYEKVLLVHSRDGHALKDLVVDLEREAFLGGYYKALAFGNGPCHLCPECAFDEGCRHADRARPCMEASGIDVFKTARAAGYPIEVVRDRGDEANFYAIVMLE